ncbi:lectin-like protein [Brunnivagina elsteri]|uniref:lectin-like protein n=1 Tax=Brunnivagina elsteri TaxID=1247191 RepID=UPI0013042B40|nr:lectin-like protein [Calothrix elsteri]
MQNTDLVISYTEITNNTSNTLDQNLPVSTSTSSDPTAAAVGGDQTLITVAGTKNYAATTLIVDPNLNVAGTTNLNGARVLIGGFIKAKDELGVSGQTGTVTGDITTGSSSLTGGITWSYNDTTGVLSLDGDSSVANYQAALRSITYTNATPADPGTARTIRFSLGKLLSNPVNGHFYEFVPSTGIAWTAANTAANDTGNKYFGRQGYLATITSSTEQNFVQQRVAGNGWIGASDTENEGTWKWVAGPESGTTFWNGAVNGTVGTVDPGRYANWVPGDEPNDFGGEDYAHVIGTDAILKSSDGTSARGFWNDLANSGSTGNYQVQGSIYEYGGLAEDSTQLIAGNVTINFGGTTLNNPITAPDFNNDGNPELLWRNYRTSGGDSGKNAAWVLDYNQAATNNKFPLINPGTKFITPTPDTGWEVEGLFDVNKDGITDIFWRNYGTGADSGKNAIWVMKNDANGIDIDTTKSATLTTVVTDTNWVIEGVADLDKDGNANILWRNYATGENAIWEIDYNDTPSTPAGRFTLNTAETKFITPVADTDWEIEGWSDMTGDGTLDIIWRNYGTGADKGKNAVWKLSNTPSATTPYFNPATDGYFITPVADTSWEIEDVIDFDKDGIGDILWRNYGTGVDKGKNAVWVMTPGGDFNAAKTDFITPVADTNWEMEGVADYTRDGIPDIVWRNYATGENAIWGMQVSPAGKVAIDLTKTSFITPVTDLAWEIEGPSPNNDIV